VYSSRESVLKAVQACLSESKGKRKFTQSIDLALNFQDLDFKKPEARVSLDVLLPHAAKAVKVAVFADGQLATEAGRVADLVITGPSIAEYAADKKKQAQLLEHALLAEAKLMAQVGKTLGQVLGARGRLPRPLPPGANLAAQVDQARRTIALRTKGKYLPTLNCLVGNEGMTPDQLADNVVTVLEALTKKVADPNVRSAFVKATMGKAFKIEAR
jgi:large subunit ribosomal protein L1